MLYDTDKVTPHQYNQIYEKFVSPFYSRLAKPQLNIGEKQIELIPVRPRENQLAEIPDASDIIKSRKISKVKSTISSYLWGLIESELGKDSIINFIQEFFDGEANNYIQNAQEVKEQILNYVYSFDPQEEEEEELSPRKRSRWQGNETQEEQESMDQENLESMDKESPWSSPPSAKRRRQYVGNRYTRRGRYY